MNWVTRLFVVSMLSLAGTVGYGALHYAGPVYRALTSGGQPRALFAGNNVFDLQSSGMTSDSSSTAFSSSGADRQLPMAMTSAAPMVTTKPPPSMDDDQNENEQSDTSASLRGTVTAINGNMITVNGQVFSLSQESEAEGNIQIGSKVKLEFSTNPDGTMTIEEIHVAMNSMTGSNSSMNSTTSGNQTFMDDDHDEGAGGDD